jgi:phosphatidate cytidylyltransferase
MMNPVLKRTITGLAVGMVVLFAILFAPLEVFPAVLEVLALLAYAEYALLLRKKVPLLSLTGGIFLVVGLIAILGGLGSLAAVAFKGGTPMRGNLMLLYVVMIVKFSDVGGFAFGVSSAKLMKGGNHKMCPSISPGKSWEGMAGSVFASCLVSLCWMPWGTGYSLAKTLALGVVAAVVGTLGDLVESKFKRWIGVKDSTALKITNGMGGLLDMFDSLIFAPAVLYPFL